MNIISRDKFRCVVSAITTFQGKMLLGRKEEKEGHPVSREWIFPGGHLDAEEELEEAVKRELKEETGLKVEVHQLVDAYQKSYSSGRTPMVRVVYHCEAESQDAEPRDDLQKVKWVQPENVGEELGETDSSMIEDRPRIANFIEKIEKMPSI